MKLTLIIHNTLVEGSYNRVSSNLVTELHTVYVKNVFRPLGKAVLQMG